MTQEVKNEFEGMPEIPPEIYDQIDKGFKKYLFFETVKCGCRRYTCTACHKTFEEGELVLKPLMSSEDFSLFHAKHNDEEECPLCGTRATVKNVKICDVTKLWASNCVAVFLANGHDDVWIRAIFAERYYRYSSDGVVSLAGVTNAFESNRYHLMPGKAVAWKMRWNDSPLERTRIFEEPFSWSHGMYMEKYDYHMVWATEGGVEATFLRYNGMNMRTALWGLNYPVRYLCHYAEHPQLEMLVRLRHESTVWNVVMKNIENSSIMDWSARKPWDLYRLSKIEYNRWAKTKYEGFNLDVLKIYKRMGGNGEKDFDIAEELNEHFYRNQNVYRFIAKCKRLKVDVRDVVKYVHRVQRNSGGGCWQCPGITLGAAYTLWEDYINLAEKAGVFKTISPMPKDLKAEHDRLLEVLKKQEERKNRNKRAAARASLLAACVEEGKRLEKKYSGVKKFYEDAQKYAYKGDKYAVVVPQGIADLLLDGRELNHCVGRAWERYFERIRSGESFLLFVRRAKTPRVPYYTIEVEPGGTVRQKRTFNDTQDQHIGEIVAFLTEWQAAIQDKLTQKDKKAAEKSRVKRLEGFAELRQNKTVVRNGHLQGKLLADVLEADLLEVGFAQPKKKKNAEKGEKRKVG